MRSVRLLAALALAASGALTATAATAAEPLLGDLTVTMLDDAGDPAGGVIQIVGTDGDTVENQPGVSTHTFSLPEGTYGVMGVTPWGGVVCGGLESCDYVGVVAGQVPLDGDVVVTPGGSVSVTLRSVAPARIAGKRLVGSALSVDYSDGMEQMLTLFGSTPGSGVEPSITWLRNGKAIPGATDSTYVPTGADTGKAIAARLGYEGLGLAYMQQVVGAGPIDPVTTAAVSVRKKSAKTFIRMVRDEITTKQRGVVRVDVTAPNAIVTGRVKVTVGTWSETRTLRNGRVAIRLPAYGPGTYVVRASYLGSSEYKPSSAKAKKLTVTR